MTKRVVHVVEGAALPPDTDAVEYRDGSADVLLDEDMPTDEEIVIGRWLTEEFRRDGIERRSGKPRR